MLSHFIIIFISVCIIIGIKFYYGRKIAYAQKLIELTKNEVADIVKISMNSPHPQIHITSRHDVIFVNTSASREFSNIQTDNKNHPVLDNIDDVKHQCAEVIYNSKYYYRTIIKENFVNQDGFMIYLHNITDIKNYELELKAAKIEAENATHARGEFLANMSHELRTPMNGIIGLSDVICETELDDDQKNMATAIHNSANSLLILLNDLLDFSKIEAGQLSLENIPFAIQPLLDQIKFIHNQPAIEKGLSLAFEINNNVPSFVCSDPNRLQQILNNLIGNAIKFTSNGFVSVNINAANFMNDNFNLSIKIIDTGIGIAPEKQKSIFEKFQQADNSTARKYGGTGLGLSITNDLVNLMDGEIFVESDGRSGSQFHILIPMKMADEIKKIDSNIQTLDAFNNDLKIMIVDDHPINILYMRKLLNQFGFQNFDEARNGDDALKLFNENNHDIILLDCQMPIMDGYMVANKIRAKTNDSTNPAIIAVTANAMAGANEKTIQAGMNDYISKPIDKQKFYNIMQKYCALDHDITVCSAQTSIFNIDNLREFTGGDKAVEAEILSIFIDNLNIDKAELIDAHSNKNYSKWNDVVHKIYGACAHIGADQLSEICNFAQDENSQDLIETIDNYQFKITRALDALLNLLDQKKSAI